MINLYSLFFEIIDGKKVALGIASGTGVAVAPGLISNMYLERSKKNFNKYWDNKNNNEDEKHRYLSKFERDIKTSNDFSKFDLFNISKIKKYKIDDNDSTSHLMKKIGLDQIEDRL